MSMEIIYNGTAPNDGTGDTLRVAADKINNNFSNLYSTVSQVHIGNIINMDSYLYNEYGNSANGDINIQPGYYVGTANAGINIPSDYNSTTNSLQIFNNSSGNVEIISENYAWQFDGDGGITFPDNTRQTTAYTSELLIIDASYIDGANSYVITDTNRYVFVDPSSTGHEINLYLSKDMIMGRPVTIKSINPVYNVNVYCEDGEFYMENPADGSINQGYIYHYVMDNHGSITFMRDNQNTYRVINFYIA